MNHPNRRVSDRIVLDLNTQCDFLLPGGALPVANRAELLPRIRQLMNWVRLEQIPVISSLEAHRASESFKGMPPHCIDHTLGQRKLPFTMMPNRMLLMGDNTADLPMDPFKRLQQIIFTKRHSDFLSNPKADRLINTLNPNYWIIFGVTATHCVKHVTLGLLARHHKVVVVRDACGWWSLADGEHAFRQMEAKGAMLVDTDNIVNGSVDELIQAHRVEFEAAASEELLKTQPAMSDDMEALEAEPAPVPEKRSNGARANGNGHTTSNGKSSGSSRRVKPAHRGPDIVPPHLIQKKGPASNAPGKPRRGLA